MTQEDKKLLLKDLCARLPYQKLVIADVDKKGKIGRQWRLIDFNVSDRGYVTFRAESSIGISYFEPGEIKPYLRPMSSMTEEEAFEFGNTILNAEPEDLAVNKIDWLNAHHFDYRNLIEKGLALEAPEGMYKEDKI